MYEMKVTIVNKYGLHVRPIMKFVETANQFESEIFVAKNGEEGDGKSPIGLMTLVATCGSELKIRAHGVDEEKAVSALVNLVQNKFDITNE